jgi:hypothetical protein
VYKKVLRDTEKEYTAFKAEMQMKIDSLEDKLQVNLA